MHFLYSIVSSFIFIYFIVFFFSFYFDNITYTLEPLENRKFEPNGYGVPALQPTFLSEETINEEIKEYVGRRNQAGIMLVRRIRNWIVEAQTPDKDPKKIGMNKEEKNKRKTRERGRKEGEIVI